MSSCSIALIAFQRSRSISPLAAADRYYQQSTTSSHCSDHFFGVKYYGSEFLTTERAGYSYAMRQLSALAVPFHILDDDKSSRRFMFKLRVLMTITDYLYVIVMHTFKQCYVPYLRLPFPPPRLHSLKIRNQRRRMPSRRSNTKSKFILHPTKSFNSFRFNTSDIHSLNS